MKLNKKKIAVFGSAIVVLGIGSFSVYAFLKADTIAVNQIKIGSVKIAVNENSYIDGNNEMDGFDSSAQKMITAENKIVNKPVRIENTGSLECYIRVWVGLEDDSLDVKFSGTQAEEQDENNYKTLKQLKETPPVNWVFDNNDGWFYYTDSRKPGEFTAALFTQVLTGDNVDSDFDIIVYSESVQCTNAKGEAYSDYTVAWKDYLKTE